MFMRNKSFFFFALLLLFLVAPYPSWAMKAAGDTVIVIEPYPGSNPDPERPRMPTTVPISASYETMLSTLFMTFTSNLGEIEVEVMNTTTGGYDSVTIDTQFLSAAVPITMGSGHYLTLFTLPSGQRYKGEFDI
jgi:hypothetical protein